MGLVETRLAIIPGGGGLVYKTVGFHIYINVSEILYKGNIYPHFIFIHFAVFVSSKFKTGQTSMSHIISL